MSTTLYDVATGTYKQILTTVGQILQKSREHFEAEGVDLQDIVMARLAEDMMPLHFQLVSVVHHSVGALKGVQSGEFSTPSFDLNMSYQELQDSISAALEEVGQFESNLIEDSKGLTFKLGPNEIPFESDVFIQTFSLPNFYFHATTTYDILRMKGAPLGKLDFLGGLKTAG